jgi:Galactose oxidase, central domain
MMLICTRTPLAVAALTVTLVAAAIFGSAANRGVVGTVARTGDTAEPRFNHTATLLPNGNVLIVGGMARNDMAEFTAELYDFRTGKFTLAGKMASPHIWGATATALPDDRVLLAGGSNGSLCTRTADLYDAASSKFIQTGEMTTSRCSAEAVLLKTGRVLIAGGDETGDANTLASAELYDPATGKFVTTGPMLTPRDYFTAVLLKDGRVLVAGGSSSGQSAGGTTVERSAEVYNPSTGQFKATGEMTTARDKLGGAGLSDGRVLIVGGQAGGAMGRGSVLLKFTTERREGSPPGRR